MTERLIGVVVVLTALAAVAREWIGGPALDIAAALGLASFLVIATPGARWSRQAFVVVGLVLAALAAATRNDWRQLLLAALDQGAFIAAFFIALASLRTPAAKSPAIERCGQYLASQPPGKRYLALTIGGHLFALILSYGAISLLGGLTEAISGREKNAEIREIRNRRMLLAIQRGFVASLTWSPLAFAMAISTAVVPGSSFSGALGFALVNAVIVTLVGYGLDRVVKPKITGPRPKPQVVGSFRDIRPLVLLLLILFAGVAFLEVISGLRIIAVVMLFVPLVSLCWIAIQSGALASTIQRLRSFVLVEVPGYRSELVLLVMAGFIGSIGGALLEPLLSDLAVGADGLPAWLILASLVWIIPILGQFGMNPILSVSMLAPLLPSPSLLGVSPNAVVVALTAGWALTGASSPFTATTLLVGRLGHTSALRVGLVWNRAFMAVAGFALSISVIVAGFVA